MMQVKYEFPLPNDGEEYRFTVEELVKLLDKVYDKGRADENSEWQFKSIVTMVESKEVKPVQNVEKF